MRQFNQKKNLFKDSKWLTKSRISEMTTGPDFETIPCKWISKPNNEPHQWRSHGHQDWALTPWLYHSWGQNFSTTTLKNPDPFNTCLPVKGSVGLLSHILLNQSFSQRCPRIDQSYSTQQCLCCQENGKWASCFSLGKGNIKHQGSHKHMGQYKKTNKPSPEGSRKERWQWRSNHFCLGKRDHISWMQGLILSSSVRQFI